MGSIEMGSKGTEGGESPSLLSIMGFEHPESASAGGVSAEITVPGNGDGLELGVDSTQEKMVKFD